MKLKKDLKERVRRGLGDAVSKGPLIEVPGFGALVKGPLEVSIKSVGARLRGRREHKIKEPINPIRRIERL